MSKRVGAMDGRDALDAMDALELDELLVYNPKDDAEIEQKKRLLRERARLVRQGSALFNNLLRGKDSAYAYVWAQNHPDRISFYSGLRYEVVRGGASGNDSVESDFMQDDGRHIRGDTILMRCNREFVEAMKANSELDAIESISDGRERFMNFSEQAHMPARQVRR